MVELIRDYKRSQQKLHKRIEELEAEKRGAAPSKKYDLNQRVIKLRAMHLELGRDIAEMERRDDPAV